MRILALPPLAIVLAMLILAFGDNFVPLVADHMSVWQYHAMRAALMLPGMIAVMAVLGLMSKVRPVRPAAVIQRSSFVTIALVLYFSAIPAVSISLAAAGLFTSPIFVVVLSVLVFRERVGWRRIAGVAVGFIGVCLVLRIGTEPIGLMALAPMLGGLMYSLSIIWTRRYCYQEHPSTMAFWNMLLFLVAGLLGTLALPALGGALAGVEGAGFLTMPFAWPASWVFGILLMMGVAAALGMVLLAYGYTRTESSYAALFDYSFLLWAPLFAWILRSEPIDLQTLAGMALIICAGVLAMSGVQRAPENADT